MSIEESFGTRLQASYDEAVADAAGVRSVRAAGRPDGVKVLAEVDTSVTIALEEETKKEVACENLPKMFRSAGESKRDAIQKAIEAGQGCEVVYCEEAPLNLDFFKASDEDRVKFGLDVVAVVSERGFVVAAEDAVKVAA